MEMLYLYCAAIGGALLLVQLLLSLIGFGHGALEHGALEGGHDAEFHVDHDGMHSGAQLDHADNQVHWFAGMLSFRAITAALAVFGLVGMGLQRRYDPPRPAAAFVVALAAGFGMMYAIGWLLRSLHQLRSDGTVRSDAAVGLSGSTYLTIPANKTGVGKVTVKVQDRIMEYSAMTAEQEIPTGTAVVVLRVVTPGTVEVARAKVPSGTTH
jgi:hypothetical protein